MRLSALILVCLGVAGMAFASDGLHVHRGPPGQIDVNRPHSPFDCDLPIGIDWYGTTQRCLAELCAGRNVYNEFVFEGDRRRRNPCYGQSPTEFPEQ